MPRPVQAQGRPGTAVIPAGWAASHAAVVTQAVATASRVKIGPPGGTSAWDEGLGRTVTQPATAVYDGIAELMLAGDSGSARDTAVVEDPVKERVYDVTLPAGAGLGIEADMVITVDPTDPDPTLAGRTLRVHAIEHGSRRFSRILLATLLD